MLHAPAKYLLVAVLTCACASGPKVDPASQASIGNEQASAGELFELGRQAAQRGDAVRAEQYLALAIEVGADARSVMPILLKACVESSHLRTALNHAEPYLLANPEDDELRRLVATIHLGLGQTADAKRELGLLLQRNEHNPDAHYLLGVIASQSDMPVARTHFEQAIQYTSSEELRTVIQSRLAELGLRERESHSKHSEVRDSNAGDGS